VSPEFYASKFQDIVNFKKSDNVLEIGKFSNPPKIEDLSNLSLDPADIEAIRFCHINKCDLKMPARFIEQSGLSRDTAPKFRLPDERYGLAFVFRVFDNVSYALVMESSRQLTPGDVVQTP